MLKLLSIKCLRADVIFFWLFEQKCLFFYQELQISNILYKYWSVIIGLMNRIEMSFLIEMIMHSYLMSIGIS